ncbi:MAG: DNA-directed RNA polymerase subunit B, partial [Candidatus Diapherotrites archaeon CG09_land_8_20_14_0_10_32_12]
MDQAKVYFDGSLLGFYEDPKKLMKEIKKLRRENKLSSSVNISYMDSTNEVYINTSAGRIQRPLIVVENGKPKVTPEHIEKIKKGTLTFEDLIKNGLVEYLDAEEEDTAL